MDRVMPVCGEFFIQKIENFSPSDENIIDLMNVLCMDVCSPIRKAASRRIAEMLTGIPPERRRAFTEALLSRYVSSKKEAERESIAEIIRKIEDAEAIDRMNMHERVRALIGAITDFSYFK